MRPIFARNPLVRKRPWYRWLLFPFLLVRWAWREAKEGADELWDEVSPPPPATPVLRRTPGGLVTSHDSLRTGW